MTQEGIIQKAFKPYLYRKTRRIEFEELQKRLIAEIEKMEITEGDYYDNSIYVDKIKLIGNGEKK